MCRAESTAALKWGTSKFEETEVVRADFREEKIIDSYVNGKPFRYFPAKKRRFYINLSILAIFGLVW